jgi:carnosine N-methyltransferase
MALRSAPATPRQPPSAILDGRGLACPLASCRSRGSRLRAARSRHLACPTCGRIYPVIDGTLPVVTPDPARHLASEAIRLRRDLDWLRDQAALLSAGARRFPRRAAVHERTREALGKTVSLLEEILDSLLAQVDRRALVEAAARPGAVETGSYGARRLTPLLRRDFGGERESELEVRTLTEAVRTELRRADTPPRRILVLGCGVGRLAEELAADGNDVCAIDLSPVLLTVALQMRVRPLELCDLQTRNARDASAQGYLFTVGQAAPAGAAGQVSYAVADATAMPFEDASWPAVVSVYFTDVVPLSRLLPELWRVLEPRGRFVHVGPLGYHFDDLAEHLSAETLLEELRAGGLAAGPARWVTSTHMRARNALNAGWFENLVFSATRTVAAPMADPALPPFTSPGARAAQVPCRR